MNEWGGETREETNIQEEPVGITWIMVNTRENGSVVCTWRETVRTEV